MITHLNVGCGPHRAPAPWWNVDLVDEGDVQPDQVVEAGTVPFDGLRQVFLGHVLEHVPWENVVKFLAVVRFAMAPGGQVCVVGPDVHRVLDLWRDGQVTDELVGAVLEHDQPQDDLGDWEGARHFWNCTEPRVIRAMRDAGFSDVHALPVADVDGWPLVSRASWQCAVVASC